MEKKPVTAIIVGAGHRALVYSELAKTNPEDLKIVGVADPNPVRRKHCMEYFGFGEDMCFESAQALAEKGKLADTVINGTMDEQHIETAIPLLNAGYDMLLEKPFAVNEKEMRELVEEIPAGRIGLPSDVGEAVAFIAENSYITGEILSVGGGFGK